jgi:hypothetical protein
MSKVKDVWEDPWNNGKILLRIIRKVLNKPDAVEDDDNDEN